MIRIVVVDRSADARSRIAHQLQHFLQTQDSELLPPISLVPLAPEELKFHSAPDVCVLGEELVRNELSEIASVRKLLPKSAILVRVDEALSSLSTVEQIARFGADDVISTRADGVAFLQKLLILARKAEKPRSGSLIVVESGKGGSGVTSVAAAVAETLLATGKRVLLVDFDCETQDLSRFLQARPFVNENLQSLLDRQRPLTNEFVQQATVQVWSDEPLLSCMAPPPESDALYDTAHGYSRTVLSMFEALDAMYDYVVVDIGSIRGPIARTLWRAADRVLFVLSNDPASLYACAEKVLRIRPLLAPAASLTVIENNVRPGGLSSTVLREEFMRAARVVDAEWSPEALPFQAEAGRWPGSGATLYSAGKGALRSALEQLVAHLSIGAEEIGKAQRVRWRIPSLLRGIGKRNADNTSATSSTSAQLPAPQSNGGRFVELPAPSPTKASTEVGAETAGLVGQASFQHATTTPLVSAAKFS